jgi:hypothetical protein
MAGRVYISENSRTALNINTNNVQATKFPQYVAAILGELIIYFQLTQYCTYELSFQIKMQKAFTNNQDHSVFKDVTNFYIEVKSVRIVKRQPNLT